MSADALRALHVPGDPLILPNVWDAATAKVVVAAGFPAVATTSSGVAEALGYQVQPPPDGFESWDAALEALGVPRDQWNLRSAIVPLEGTHPRVFFQRVPEGKTVKNRLHFDLRADGVSTAEELERLLALGARPVDVGQGPDVSWVVLGDPEGNEFCLLSRSVLDVEAQE